MDRLFTLQGKRILLQSPEYPYGQQIAQGLLAAGARVCLCGEDEAVMAQIHAASGQPGEIAGRFYYRPGTEADAKGLGERALACMGVIDGFVHISPPGQLQGWLHGFEQIYQSMRSTQLGLMLTVKHIGLCMAQQNDGAMLFVTDYAALVGCDMQNYAHAPAQMEKDFSLDYGFIKGAYVNYARQAAGFLGAHTIRCNSIAYGPLAGSVPAGFEEAFIRHSHLKRLAQPEDIQAAAVFLLADASRYITGITMPVDGGYTAK